MREPLDQIETRLRELGCPDHVIARHVERLRKLRRVKRKRLMLVLEGNHLVYRAVIVRPAQARLAAPPPQAR